ncbi:hypothetical protein Tco_0912374, partial [Tanacetum coccineum]
RGRNTIVLRLSVNHRNLIQPRATLPYQANQCSLSFHQGKQVERGIIELYFVKTEYQLAHIFMEALSQDRFEYLVRRPGMRCLTSTELEVLGKETA